MKYNYIQQVFSLTNCDDDWLIENFDVCGMEKRRDDILTIEYLKSRWTSLAKRPQQRDGVDEDIELFR